MTKLLGFVVFAIVVGFLAIAWAPPSTPDVQAGDPGNIAVQKSSSTEPLPPFRIDDHAMMLLGP